MAALEVGVRKARGVTTSIGGEVRGEIFRGGCDPPRFEYRVPLFVRHAEGAAVTEAFCEVKVVDEAGPLGAGPIRLIPLAIRRKRRPPPLFALP